MKFIIKLLVLILVSYQEITATPSHHRCIHDKIRMKNVPVSPQKSARSAKYMPIRIVPYFVNQYMKLDQNTENLIKNRVVKDVLDYFNSALAVIPVQHNLRFSPCSYVYTSGVNSGKCAATSPPMCGPIPFSIPKDHLYGIYCSNAYSVQSCSTYANGTGVPNADFVLYVFAVNTTDCYSGNTLAYSTSCLTNYDGRPIAGYVNFCAKNLGRYPDYHAVRSIATHEIIHSLGFESEYFKRFKNPQGKTYSAVEYIRINNEERAVIKSPTALQVARRYFKCPNLRGILLEDEGSSGTAGSHWEMTILKSEIMQPSLDIRRGRDVSISEFTLAVLQDSGWYLANFSAISPYKLLWGKGLGCDFVNKPCSNPATYPYLCYPNVTRVGCNFDFQARAACVASPFSNGCHIMEPAEPTDCWQPKRNDKACSSFYGTSSQCLIGTIEDTLHISHSNFPYCFQTKCQINPNNGRATFKVTINNQEKICYRKGQKLVFSGCNGYAMCPSPEDACMRYKSYLPQFYSPLVCSSYCSKCSDDNSCQTCLKGYYMHNHKCYQQCPMGTFVLQHSYNCQDCNTTRCTSCRNTPNYCTGCAGSLVANDGICVDDCPMGRSIPPHSDECTDNGVIIKKSYEILFLSRSGIENSDIDKIKNSFQKLIQSQALVGNSIEFMFLGNATDYFVIQFSLQGSYTKVMKSYKNILLRFNHQQLNFSINGNQISAFNFTAIPEIDIVFSPSAPIFPTTTGMATTIPFMNPTIPNQILFLNLTVWQWILIGIGVLLGLAISMALVWWLCRKRSNSGAHSELLLDNVIE